MSDTEGFYKKPTEIEEINAAIEHHKDIRWWEKRLGITAWVVYFGGVIIWGVRGIEAASPILLMSFAVFMVVIAIGQVEIRRRRAAQKLIHAYKRKQALPLYQDMLEKFADQPNLHIHLNDDGTIVITDRKG